MPSANILLSQFALSQSIYLSQDILIIPITIFFNKLLIALDFG